MFNSLPAIPRAFRVALEALELDADTNVYNWNKRTDSTLRSLSIITFGSLTLPLKEA